MLSVIVLGYFSALSFLRHSNYAIASVDLFAMISVLGVLFYIHTYKNFERAVLLTTATFFLFLLSFAYVNENDNLGLMWTTFFPLFFIVLNGIKRGLIFVGVYYLILFYIAYSGVDHWQNGEWSFMSFMRFSVASLILSVTIWFMEYSQEFSEDRLERVRAKEAKMMEELKRLTIVDPLTQLYNRRHLTDVFKRQFQIARRHKMYFSIFILDIDFFKPYNDTYGHQMGDDALRSVADALKQHMRRSDDYIFRYGGEEFSGICMHEDKEKIQEQIASTLGIIESLKIEHSGSTVSDHLTVSIGAKITDDFENYSFDQLLKEADDALYRAKDESRNTIVFV
ncbi:MAG: diguanylate cyclase [Sulfurimonas sp.]|nr:diguanylate cyclase [Sulfurimonas sp.]